MSMLLNLVALTFVWELDDQVARMHARGSLSFALAQRIMPEPGAIPQLMLKREYKAVEILFREMAQGRQLKDVSQNLKVWCATPERGRRWQ